MDIVRDEGARVIEPQTNRPFSIHAPGWVWIVKAGKLDLFIIPTANGEPAGAREYVLRVDQGQAVFGVEPHLHAETGLFASAASKTQLLLLSATSFRKLLNTDQDITDPTALVEQWVANFTAAVSNVSPPKIFTELQKGIVIDTGAEPKPAMAIDGVAWIKHQQGLSHFQNNRVIDPIDGRVFFPVTSTGWVQPLPNGRIVSVSSKEWQEADPEWDSLKTFHKTMMQLLMANRRAEEDKEQRRLLNQAENNRAIIADALSTLASTLRDGSDLPVSSDLELPDPVLKACQAVGGSLGVNIVAPPEMQAGIKSKEPVPSIAFASGLRHRMVALKGKWWNQAAGPLIAFRDADNRPLALLPGRKSGYELYDPVEQTTVQVDGALALTLNGFAYAFYRPLPNRRLSLWDLMLFGMKGMRPELVTIVTMGIAVGLLGMVTPIATGVIFDSVIPSAQRTQLLEICGCLFLFAIAASMFTFTRGLAMLRLEGKVGSSLQAAVWDRLLRLPVPFFRRYTSGDLADRSLGIEYILRMLTATALSSILSGVFSIFSFLLLFYYSSQLAIVAAALMFVAFAVPAVGAYFQVRYQRGIFQMRGRMSGLIFEFVQNIARLRVSGAETRAFAVWAREFAAQKKLSISSRKIQNGLTVFNSAFPLISLAVIFGYAARLIGQAQPRALSTGMFLAFLAAFLQFQLAALFLSSAVGSVLGIIPIYERVAPILEAIPEVREGNKYPGELTGSLELNHLNFRYHPGTPLVLQDFSLTVKAGEFVAIVGPSGGGKSTLLRLLLGFESPESGKIYYDGQDLEGLDIQAVRKQLGVVIQNARLGSGTIFSNIVGSAPLSHDDAWAAATLAGLDQDIREMPMGMYTVIGEGGGNLSGGQRQRLLIARAMVRKPRIFLFDEATSALDNQTQATVRRSLDSFQATRIVIAHRLSTIINADWIVVIEKGMLVQSGTYADLMNTDGLFRRLAQRQLS